MLYILNLVSIAIIVLLVIIVINFIIPFQVEEVKNKAVILSEYPENKFRSVLSSLFGAMPALLTADNLSSSSDSSYVSTVTDLSAAETTTPVSETVPPSTAATATTLPDYTAPTTKQAKKKSQRKRKKPHMSDKVTLPPPPPPAALDTPAVTSTVTSASYADMLRKPQPLILSECSSETDLTPPVSKSSQSVISTPHSASCPNIAWDACPTSQCKHRSQLEFLNESSISAAGENHLEEVIPMNQGDLQSVFETSKCERSSYQINTTLRPYSVYNHQSDTISETHQKLINYFSRGK